MFIPFIQTALLNMINKKRHVAHQHTSALSCSLPICMSSRTYSWTQTVDHFLTLSNILSFIWRSYKDWLCPFSLVCFLMTRLKGFGKNKRTKISLQCAIQEHLWAIYLECNAHVSKGCYHLECYPLDMLWHRTVCMASLSLVPYSLLY